MFAGVFCCVAMEVDNVMDISETEIKIETATEPAVNNSVRFDYTTPIKEDMLDAVVSFYIICNIFFIF